MFDINFVIEQNIKQMSRYDTISIPTEWLPEIIKKDEFWDAISEWQTKDLNNEYDMYIFNIKSRQMFMQDYELDLVDKPNSIFKKTMKIRLTNKIKQLFDDTLLCVSMPGTVFYEIKLSIVKGILTDIKIIKIFNFKHEL